jgi:predicted dehydrogenase
VIGWRTLERLDDLYFVRRGSWRLLWNYLRELGPLEVARKVVSRRSERHRNSKFVSVGLGRVLEAPTDADLSPGAPVAFLAPCHPACQERVVLPRGLLAAVDEDEVARLPPGGILHHPIRSVDPGGAWWRSVRGWQPESGVPLPAPGALMRQAVEVVRGTDWSSGSVLPCVPESPISEVRGPGAAAGRTPARGRAVLFGYGNYAKTVVLPNLRPYLEVDRVHEIDPTQIPVKDAGAVTWDTSPWPRGDEAAVAMLIAGYHHTHAPLAVEALRRGSYAVVEKPVVSTEAQLEELLDVVRTTPRLFACFHKRYLPFNELALRDLELGPEEPVSYHCIVYEVPLPALHWYRWPASRSRLVSNGCHWIDHFLHLNGYAEVRGAHVVRAADGTLNCSAELENGAFFTMVLTDEGSARIGVQDHVELRAGGVTVRMVNGSRYEAEGPDRLLRRVRINKIRSYREMYREIGRRVAAGEPGDSVRSLEVGSRLMLELERLLGEQDVREGAGASGGDRSILPTTGVA